jgi:hypothetical protein
MRRIVLNKMRKLLYPAVLCLVMWAIIAPITLPASKTVSARAQQPGYAKTGAFVGMETMLSRIFPFYRRDSWLSTGRKDFDARYSFLKAGLSNKIIVPTQEQGKTSVPFKGWITKEGIAKEGIAKEGTVSLVLKIYDQSNGGTKLYEAIHEVEVTHGQYFAFVQVPSEAIANSQTIWLEAASVEEKEVAFEPRQQLGRRAPRDARTAVHADGTVLCYTCGSFWPEIVGAFPVSSGNPIEFGSQCAFPAQTRTDYRPYLCN